ncbi:MAG: MgtC/SapB family protein [Bacteroidetes bacterium]|jgi:putative Mg2+ transporter-C (MgtC) family protein|nr:MgtC/SapB family protein [Bacteroidota bacterium]
MNIEIELIIIPKLIVAFGLGLFIGLDRERQGKDAGIRTYAAVCLGATLFTTVAEQVDDDITSISRIVANIVTGIGFLGAGIIYRNRDSKSSHGLTTAATIWCTAAVGVAIGLDMFFIAITASLMIYFLLSLERRKWYMQWKNKIKNTDNNNDKSN